MSATSQPLVSINNVTRTFTRGAENVHVLTGLELAVADGEF